MRAIVERVVVQWQLITLLAIVAVVLIGVMSTVLPPAIDWHDTFRPATLELLSLRNPYTIEGYYYPTWALFILAPMAILPENIGRAVFVLVSLIAAGYAAWRLGAKPISLAAFLASPPMIHEVLNANIDWMVLLGFTMPPRLGLFFVIIKPQVGFVVAIFWLIEAWRKGRWREVIRVFWPVTIGMLISFVVFGLWPLRYGRTLSFWWNASLWPASIPIGLALLVASLRRRRIEYAMAASPCLSPYVLFHSWAGALMAIVASSAETIAAVIGLWILVLIRAVS